MNRDTFSFSADRTLRYLTSLLALAYLIPFYITRALWWGESNRFYPTTPVSSFLPAIDAPYDVIIWAGLGLLQLAILLCNRSHRLLFAFVVVVTCYSFWDQSRWLPYYYQFTVMMYIIALAFRSRREDVREASVRILGLLMLSIWLWSGIHKFNVRYLFVGFPWLMEPFDFLIPSTVQQYSPLMALVSATVEAGSALLLLFPATRVLGVLMLCAMHSVILFIFGPLGHNFNSSVWSWNVFQAVACVLLFVRDSDSGAREYLIPRGGTPLFKVHLLVLLFFTIAPLANMWGYYDDFLSHALYSWNTMEAEIHSDDEKLFQELPREVHPALESFEGRRFIHILKWSYEAFESPPYHSERVFFRVFEKVCMSVSAPQQLQLKIFKKPSIFSGKSETQTYRCE